ncbi:hypothetical protein SAMN05444161_0018 [Rhizobiales bacterium GAS191]|nr:hypothetical protein SAMN05444161_0018 [Rhizobiales bacterium GAS191]
MIGPRCVDIAWRRPLPGPRTRINRCGICGAREPAMFDVPTIVWEHYVPPDERAHMLCIDCWRRLVAVTDGGTFQDQHGGPPALWCDAWRVRKGPPVQDAPLNEFGLYLWHTAVLAGVPDGGQLTGSEMVQALYRATVAARDQHAKWLDEQEAARLSGAGRG